MKISQEIPWITPERVKDLESALVDAAIHDRTSLSDPAEATFQEFIDARRYFPTMEDLLKRKAELCYDDDASIAAEALYHDFVKQKANYSPPSSKDLLQQGIRQSATNEFVRDQIQHLIYTQRCAGAKNVTYETTASALGGEDQIARGISAQALRSYISRIVHEVLRKIPTTIMQGLHETQTPTELKRYTAHLTPTYQKNGTMRLDLEVSYYTGDSPVLKSEPYAYADHDK